MLLRASDNNNNYEQYLLLMGRSYSGIIMTMTSFFSMPINKLKPSSAKTQVPKWNEDLSIINGIMIETFITTICVIVQYYK